MESSFTLLPEEMLREIVGHLPDVVADSAALARTCKDMLGRVHVPCLPNEWRSAWDDLKQRAGRLTAKQILCDLVDAGVPTWPGALRYAFDGGGQLCFRWTWTHRSTRFHLYRTFTDPLYWTLCVISNDVEYIQDSHTLLKFEAWDKLSERVLCPGMAATQRRLVDLTA